MAFKLLTHATASGINGGTTPSIDTTGANLLIAGLVAVTSGSATLTDNQGNTWTLLPAQSGVPACRIAYVLAPKVHAAHTFAFSGLASLAVLCIAAFKGAHLEAVDAQVAFDSQSGSNNLAYINAAQPGDVLPSMAHMLIVTAFGWASVATMATIDPSMTLIDQVNMAALVNYGGGLAYLIQDVQASVATQWNFALTMAGSVAVAVFRAAFGGSDFGGPFQTAKG